MNLRQVRIRLAVLGTSLAAILGGHFANLQAQETGKKGAVIEEVRNEQASFFVRVDVDRKDRIYAAGEKMAVTVRSERDGYLYLFYFMADGSVSCLFPNKHQTDNFIRAGKKTHVPPRKNADFRIRIGPPFGDEVLKAVVTQQPLTSLDVLKLTQNERTDMDVARVRRAFVDQLQNHPTLWSAHDVEILTVEDRSELALPADPAPGPNVRVRGFGGPARRIGVFIGIDACVDEDVRPLKTAAKDAQAMKELMCRCCSLDDCHILVNGDATLDNIRRLLYYRLPELTNPGDTVILYISTHGARCPDDNGDESDGYDEVLMMSNSLFADLATIRNSTLTDDIFGVWLQRLDGCKVIVLLDSCHSAGHAAATAAPAAERGEAQAKGLPQCRPFEKSIQLPGVPQRGKSNFLDGELGRVKDLGQPDLVLLAAARADETAFERREGDLSVMTYFLIELIQSQADQDAPVTLQDAYRYLRKTVPAHVRLDFPGKKQTPVLTPDDRNAKELFLRP